MNTITSYIGKLNKISWRQVIGLCCIVLVLGCVWLDTTHNKLADKMLRLHVLANSDSAQDQRLKLTVRDELLKTVQPWLDASADITGVKESLRAHLPELETMASAVIAQEGYDYPVRVTLEESFFPTRLYEGFALPAGEYEALRVQIGAAEGQNWWCVVFPPLCVAAGTQEIQTKATKAGLQEQEVFLILEDSRDYVIKFRAIEIWESLKHTFA